MAVTETTPTVRRRGPGPARIAAVVAVMAGALGFVLWRGLDDATLYFRTADEAVAQKETLGTRRFRIEGVVQRGTVEAAADGVRFTIEENGARVPVRHVGDPPGLFRPDIPVVLEGRWDGDLFASDRIMVKHTNEYRADHPDRVERDGE